jgi:MFS family permease
VAGTVLTIHRSITHPRALIEAALFRSREFTTASVALSLFFVAFATWLLVTVLFLQDVWHYGPVRAGLAMSPGPLVAALFALNSGWIGARFGRVLPALTGTLLIIVSAGF